MQRRTVNQSHRTAECPNRHGIHEVLLCQIVFHSLWAVGMSGRWLFQNHSQLLEEFTGLMRPVPELDCMHVLQKTVAESEIQCWNQVAVVYAFLLLLYILKNVARRAADQCYKETFCLPAVGLCSHIELSCERSITLFRFREPAIFMTIRRHDAGRHFLYRRNAVLHNL